jgi:two-component system chemotaxis response regulator CheB
VQWKSGHYYARVVNGPAVWHQRPAVDLLFKSVADCGAASQVIGGLLTGMGRDGADGLLRLRERGATTFAQDEASCVVYGMPRAAWENGAAQRQVRLDRIADFILQALESPRPAPAAELVPTSP